MRHAIAKLQPGFNNLRVRRSPLRLTVSNEGQELNVTQLSDGEKCLLAMVGDLAQRLAIANPNSLLRRRDRDDCDTRFGKPQ